MSDYSVKLSQAFNVFDAFTPTKASVYLKPFSGGSSIDYFDVSTYDSSADIWGATIDSLNFSTLVQDENALMALEDVLDYTGAGYLESIGSGDDSQVNYPIRSDTSHTGVYVVYIRARSITGRFNVKLFLDDTFEVEIDDAAVPDTSWRWYNTTITISDTDTKLLGIRFFQQGSSIDKIYISPNTLETVPVGQGHSYTDAPYITLHAEVYTVDNNDRPVSPLMIYDYKTTLTDVLTEGWYNFDLNFLEPGFAVSFPNSYAIVLFAAGSNNDRYILWELQNFDEYICGSSAIKVTSKGTAYYPPQHTIPHYGYYYMFRGIAEIILDYWYIRSDKNFALRIYSNYDALDEYNEKIVIPPASEIATTVNEFTTGISNLMNMDIVADEAGGQDIQLELNPKIINMIFDKSGSMSWNDSDNTRYDIAERFIRKLSAVYPGSVRYSIFIFGGQPFAMVFAAGSEEDIDTPSLICSADAYGDSASHFYGVRVVRNTDHYPLNPIDGDIIFDGISESMYDNDLLHGTTYYYKVFTFDNNGNFSTGKDLQITHNGTTVPPGLSLLQTNVLKGSGPTVDEHVESAWHFDEHYQIEYNNRRVYDFTENVDLLCTETTPRWLNQSDVPSGSSGLHFNGVSTALSSDEVAQCIYQRGFTIMGWIKPLNFDTQRPVIARQSAAVNEWMISIQNATGFVLLIVKGVTVGTSTIPVSRAEWNHIAVVIDSSGVGTFYVNGITAGTFISPQSDVSSLKFVDIGYDRIGGVYFWGKICEMSVHNTARDIDYISDYAPMDTKLDRDNGDRLVVVSGTIPTNPGYNALRIVSRPFVAPSNENDGEIVYDRVVSPGIFYTTYKDEFVTGATYNIRIFTQNSYGNYSNIYDSHNIPTVIPSMSDETRDSLGFVSSTTLPTPSIATVLEGNQQIYLAWEEVDEATYRDAVSVRIYASNDGFPTSGDYCYDGELIFEGDISETFYVHHDVVSDQDYYYTIVFIDQYGRRSESAQVKATGNGTDSMSSFPLLDVESTSYEITDSNSVKIFWNNVLPSRTIEVFFPDKVALYAKIIDDNGDIIERDDLEISLSVDASYGYGEDAGIDYFAGNTEMSVPVLTEMYNYAIEKMVDGEVKGSIYINNRNEELRSDIEFVDLRVRMIASIKDPNNDTVDLFRYISSPIYIRFKNTFSMYMVNKDRKYVTIRCSKSLESLQQATYDYPRYNGLYLGASSDYTVRVYLSLRDRQISGGTIDVQIREASFDWCNRDATPTDSGISNVVLLPDTTLVITNTIEDVLDSDGVPTGGKKAVSYVDLPIPVPDSRKTIYVYVKYTLGGYSLVKRHIILFNSPLQLDVVPNIPIADGIQTSEQFATVYLIDPDNPDDNTTTTAVDDILVKWELTPIGVGSKKTLSYNGTHSIDVPPPQNGIYSYVSNGVTHSVLIGPVQEVIFETSSDAYTYETHELKVSCSYGNYSVEKKHNLEFLPLSVDKSATTGSYLLMEFDDYKQEFWTDGRGYGKMTISHDPSSSTTKYSNAFRSCLSASGKELIELQPGQSVFINTDNPDLEIIWGDVLEYVDPYVGDWVLDTTNATIGRGSAFIRLSNNDETYVFFRKASVTTNSQIGFERPENSPCSDFLGVTSVIKYQNEITVTGSAVSLHDGPDGTVSISLFGGGNVNRGIIPTVLAPKEPLLIRPIDRRVSGSSVDGFVMDGTSINEILLDVSFAGHIVPAGTEITVTVVNNGKDVISVSDSIVDTYNDIDGSISSNLRSYASVVLRPIPSGVTFNSDVYFTITYDLEGDILRTQTFCINISADAEDYLADTSNVRSIFTRKTEIRDQAVDVGWTNVADMNTSRAFHQLRRNPTVGQPVYACGGINGSRVLNSVDAYDGDADTWTGSAAMRYPRMMAQSVDVGDGESAIYIFGGIDYDVENHNLYITDRVERYDTATGLWNELEPMPTIDLGGPDRAPYAIACGTAIRDTANNKIYIYSGIRKITDDGSSVEYNDRILVYDIALDSWSYSDPITDDELPEYKRAFPVPIWDAIDKFVIVSGVYSDDDTFEYKTDGYMHRITPDIISSMDDEATYSEMPRFCSQTSIVYGIVTHYFIGGRDGTINNMKKVEELESHPLDEIKWQINPQTNMNFGRSGLDAEYLSMIAGEYMMVSGGILSGKGNNFLKISTDVFQSNMYLDRGQSVEVLIEVADYHRDAPSEEIQASVKGYLQLADVAEGSEHIIPEELLSHKVQLSEQMVTLVNGQAITKLQPRYDDYLYGLMNNVTFTQNVDTLRYKIVVQVTIEDTVYYGQTFVNTSGDSVSVPNSVAGIPCLDGSSNLAIEALQNPAAVGNFELLASKIRQGDVAIVNCYSNYPWIPSVDNVTSDGIVSASSAIDLIDDLRDDADIGGSPLWDCLVGSSAFLSQQSYWTTEKSTYAFTDSGPCCSVYSMEQAAVEVNGIDGYEENPVMILNMSIGSNIALPTLYRYTNYPPYETFVSQTNGQGISISDSDMVDDLVLMMSGAAKGSLGYGSSNYVYDFEDVVNLKSVLVNYLLYANTNGRWRFSVSENNYSYSDYSAYFEPNYTAYFDGLLCRYVKFDFELYSGLSTSNEEGYEDVPTAGVPRITDIDFGYAPQKVDYMYIDTTTTTSTVDQVIVAVDSNDQYNDNKSIEIGCASGQYTHHWNDFAVDGQPAVENSGKIVVPLRNGEAEDMKIEPLINIDGYSYKTANIAWSPEAVVSVTVGSTTVSPSSYSLLPRDGLVVFNENRSGEGQHYISIQNLDLYRVGLKIINNDEDNVEIHGVAEIYNEQD